MFRSSQNGKFHKSTNNSIWFFGDYVLFPFRRTTRTKLATVVKKNDSEDDNDVEIICEQRGVQGRRKNTIKTVGIENLFQNKTIQQIN